MTLNDILSHPLARVLFDVTANEGWNLIAWGMWAFIAFYCAVGLIRLVTR